MKSLRTLALVGTLVTAAIAGHAFASEPLRLGAMPLNTWWYVGGGAIANLVQTKLPAGTTIEVLARGGGIANPVVTNENKTQIAFSNVATAAWARMGEEEIYKGKKHEDIRSLGRRHQLGLDRRHAARGLHQEDRQRHAGKGARRQEPARHHEAGRQLGPAGRADGRAVARHEHRRHPKDGRLIQVDAAQTTSMLRDGRADLYFESAAKGHPAVTEVTLTVDMRFIDMPQKALDVLAKNGLKPSPMPVFFKGQNEPDQGRRPRHDDHRAQVGDR